MSNVNVGTIFALESQVPSFSEINSLNNADKAVLNNTLKSWSILGSNHDNSDMLNVVNEKEREMLFELLKIS
ncbi:hypothetical protein KC675_04030, partial [Candidatus Dojkabacteria bacterium]|nr:hypothetical protein [Candidatus Dojkabacteria bacterium]